MVTAGHVVLMLFMLAFFVHALRGGFSVILGATPGLGFKSYFQIGLETVWGTPVAATRRLGFISYKPDPGIGRILDPTLNNSVSRTSIYQGPLRPGLKIRTRLDYQGLDLMWDTLMGTGTFGSNGGTVTGAGPYTKTFIEQGLLNALTLQIIAGNIPSTKCDRLEGAKLQGVEINVPIGDQPGTVDWDFIGEAWLMNQTPTGALTAASALPVLYSEASTVDDGTADGTANMRVRSARMSIRNPLEAEPYLGSLNPDEPQRGDFIEVLFQMTKQLYTSTMGDAAVAFTVGSPKLVFGSSASKRLTFDIGTAYIKTYAHEVNKYGIILQDCEWEGVYDGTNLSAMKITTENTIATIS